MKIIIDTETDSFETATNVINMIFNKNSKDSNPSQTKILDNNTNNDSKQFICDKCGADLHQKYDQDTANKIRNYCKIQYRTKGDKYKLYCKDCQKTLPSGGGSP